MFRVDFREFHKESETVAVWTAARYPDRATAEWHAQTLRERVTHPEVGLWDVIVRECNGAYLSGGTGLSEEQEADVPARQLEMSEM